MKKLLGLTLSLATLGFIASPSAANAAPAAGAPAATVAAGTVAPQWRDRRNQRNRRWNSRVRVVNQTRLVRVGRRVYRETYQVRYLPNGRTQTRLISRVRVR